MPQEPEKADGRQQWSHPNEYKSPEDPISHSASSEMLKPWRGDINEQRSSTDPRSSMTVDCLGLKLVPNMVADCLASFIPYEQDSNYDQVQGLSQSRCSTQIVLTDITVTMNQNTLVPYNNTIFRSEKGSNFSSASTNPYSGSLLHNSFNELLVSY